MRIKTYLPLSELCVYVQREPEAEKKLTAKDPRSYGVGPTRFDKLTINPVASMFIIFLAGIRARARRFGMTSWRYCRPVPF